MNLWMTLLAKPTCLETGVCAEGAKVYDHFNSVACVTAAWLWQSNYTAIRAACNMWRNYGDVTDAWTSVTDIVNYFGKNHDNFSKFTGPGGWADPDMVRLEIYV